MRGAVRVVLVLAVLGAGIVLPGTVAQACSCVAAGEAKYLQWADAVFYGEVIDREVRPKPSGADLPFGARVTYT
ncbi:MAG TPA: hypothetical protein VFX15_13145, partial [Actinomycetes bacterium]|nr:hypothetical protein [Actinomycetes bacterium]